MTYSTNFGIPSIEATNWNDLQQILEQLPDNTAQLISPKDVRDAIFTTWETSIFKAIDLGSDVYIGTDNSGTVSNFRYKMLFGKRELQGTTVMNSLLGTDTDIYFYNNKIDSNLSLQNTKLSFLAGDDFSIFINAPYLEAKKITSPNRIDLELNNPSVGGIIEINSDIIELGDTNGWIIEDTSGELYPNNSGQNIGTNTNRIGTIYMNSTIDYASDLIFTSNSNDITFDTDGKITTDSIDIISDFKFGSGTINGNVLTVDNNGNASWQPSTIDSTGITVGYIPVADGIVGIDWFPRLADANGVPDGYILSSDDGETEPIYRPIGDIPLIGVTAGYVLSSTGTVSSWVSPGSLVVSLEDVLNNNNITNGNDIEMSNGDSLRAFGSATKILFSSNGVLDIDVETEMIIQVDDVLFINSGSVEWNNIGSAEMFSDSFSFFVGFLNGLTINSSGATFNTETFNVTTGDLINITSGDSITMNVNGDLMINDLERVDFTFNDSNVIEMLSDGATLSLGSSNNVPLNLFANSHVAMSIVPTTPSTSYVEISDNVANGTLKFAGTDGALGHFNNNLSVFTSSNRIVEFRNATATQVSTAILSSFGGNSGPASEYRFLFSASDTLVNTSFIVRGIYTPPNFPLPGSNANPTLNLPSDSESGRLLIITRTAGFSTFNVAPPSGGTINGSSSPVNIGADSGAIFVCIFGSTNEWVTIGL